MKTISLTQGYVAIVDDEDYDLVVNLRWHASKGIKRVATHVTHVWLLLCLIAVTGVCGLMVRACSQSEEGTHASFKSVNFAFMDMPLGSVIVQRDPHFKNLLSTDNLPVLVADSIPLKISCVSWIECRWEVGNMLGRLFHVAKKYSPMGLKVEPGKRTKVFYLHPDSHLGRFFRRDWAVLSDSFLVSPNKNATNHGSAYEWSTGIFRGNSYSSSEKALPCGECGIDYNGHESQQGNNKVSLFVGGFVAAISIFFLAVTWWRVNFKLTANSNVAFYVLLVIAFSLLLMVGLALIGMGCGLVVHVTAPVMNSTASFLVSHDRLSGA